MNFRKSSKRLLTPPPHFRKVTLRFSRQNCDKSAYVHMEEHLCILWSYFPWDACSTNVQHGNKVKTYTKRPFCITFMLKKPCLKVQILQYKFLDWKWPPPPSDFSENSSVLEVRGFPNSSSTRFNLKFLLLQSPLTDMFKIEFMTVQSASEVVSACNEWRCCGSGGSTGPGNPLQRRSRHPHQRLSGKSYRKGGASLLSSL